MAAITTNCRSDEFRRGALAGLTSRVRDARRPGHVLAVTWRGAVVTGAGTPCTSPRDNADPTVGYVVLYDLTLHGVNWMTQN
jgi:hypothetical protein